MGVCVMSENKNSWLDYELIGLDLSSLSAMVEALGSHHISSLADENTRQNCFSIVSEVIQNRAELVDEMFNEHFEMIKREV